MDYANYFEDLFESIPDYKQIVLLKFIIRKDDDLSNDRSCLKNDLNRLHEELKKN